jgi:hypothetical protein
VITVTYTQFADFMCMIMISSQKTNNNLMCALVGQGRRENLKGRIINNLVQFFFSHGPSDPETKLVLQQVAPRARILSLATRAVAMLLV